MNEGVVLKITASHKEQTNEKEIAKTKNNINVPIIKTIPDT